MPSREELHKLVDSIPDAAIDAAHQVLSRFQSWPPPPTPYGADRKIRMTETRTAAGTRAGFSSWDGDTYVVGTHRSVRGHELTIVESIRVEGEHLIYKHEVTGPGGKRDEREITFELTHE
jgi:hypothetical protein